MQHFTAFELSPELEKALLENNFIQPTNIQTQILPIALEGKDILGSSPTGTGKTLAFLIPVIQHILDNPKRKKIGSARILILTPTRELAIQIHKQAEKLLKYTKIKVNSIIGGVAYQNHQEIFNHHHDIIIATPGRLLQYIKEEHFDSSSVEILIFDEADRMLEMGFGQDAEIIMAETRWRKQSMLFSATLSGQLLEDFADRLLKEPIRIEANSSRRECAKILQFYYHADNLEHKIKLLARVLLTENTEKAIVFVRKREKVREIAEILRKRNIRTCYLEGNMAQTQRLNALTKLKDKVVNVLVSTDVSARGIDIEDVTHIINFDMPYRADTYIHRIGRTGRAGKKGIAISLVEGHDYTLLGKIKRYTNDEIKIRVIEDLKPKTKPPKAGEIKKTTKKAKAQLKEKKDKKLQEAKIANKTKDRIRNKKNIGKRRKSNNTQE